MGGGEDVTVEGLAGIMRKLAVEDRVENWNLVSPTPYLPSIREAAFALRKDWRELSRERAMSGNGGGE